MTEPVDMTAAPALAVASISKTFEGVPVLQAVDLTVRRGEITALVGENGSGKSTLIKIITGVYLGDPGGTITIGRTSVPAHKSSPEAAHDAGVRVVHQQLGLFGSLTVVENFAAACDLPRGAGGRIRWRDFRSHVRATLDRFDVGIDLDTPVEALSPSEKALVGIARALADEPAEGILILDEPTAALPAAEVEDLLARLRDYRDRGLSILYVSHRLDEVLAISDKVAVLRGGRLVGKRAISDLSDSDELVELIVGHAVEPNPPKHHPDRQGGPVLRVSDIECGAAHDISFELHAGDIVGLAGLGGSGGGAVLRGVFGAERRMGGRVLLDGDEIDSSDIAGAVRRGIAYVPGDRAAEGVFGDLSLAENLTVSVLDRFRRRCCGLNQTAQREAAAGLMAGFDIRPADPSRSMATLSGGNQQKAVLARWLQRRPRVLLLDEPSQGVDIASRAQLHDMIHSACANGMSAVISSADTEELARVCDRVLILSRGRIAEELTGRLTAGRINQRIFVAEAKSDR